MEKIIYTIISAINITWLVVMIFRKRNNKNIKCSNQGCKNNANYNIENNNICENCMRDYKLKKIEKICRLEYSRQLD